MLTKFSKKDFKLLNSSAFGKPMEKFRNRVVIKLITNNKSYQRLVSKISFVSQKVFQEDLVAGH